MNDPEQDAAAVLSQVVPLGDTARQAELGAAVSRHVSLNRPAPTGPDPETVAALRKLAAIEPPTEPDGAFSPLSVMVDFNALFEDIGEPEIWTILGKLKDLFGGTT